ncbi:MAG: hypothetical protein HS111_22700 [Kofleriaceae bacterium]|nr:hypothetical protein [Kofleriaceae bacterium]MCL4224819.1 hypothetical protein [Myxococcales bacterium]
MQGRALWQRVRWVLALLALCALATCPAAQRRCAARRDAGEAPVLLRYLVAEVTAQVAATGKLPDVNVGPTPPLGTCCAAGSTCAPDPAWWRDPGWRALRFSIDDRHRFSYQVRRDGPALVLTATGNRDCDGVLAVVEVRLVLDGGRLVETWTRRDPYE